ncbi:MAG: Bug family tripartite tricarboxylate transporter substrate binding protein [Cupriavidus necator]
MMRFLKHALTIALLAVAPLVAHAQNAWPSKPLRLIVPFPPGAPGDVIARLIQPGLQQAFKQPVIIENKPGASGNIGMAEVLRVSDEHTVLLGVDTMLTINPYIYKKLTFKPGEDFVPVTHLASFSQILVCHANVGVKTLPDLLALSRKQDLSYASGGPGVPGHLTMEMLLAATQARMAHVPYRGPNAALQDMLGGIVPCGFLTSPVVSPFIKEGKLVAIAVSGNKRLASHPGVPTIEEAGVKGYDATFSEMVAMPKGTPALRVQRLQREIAGILGQPDVRAKLAILDLEPVANSPEQAARRLKDENTKWGAVVARIGLQVD